jgi:hypothetical protein
VARIRTIKPDFFLHEGLFDLEQETGFPIRVAFAGLWCQCDREGRFKWQPRRLKTQVLPYDDHDFSRVLDALTTRGFIVKYTVKSVEYGQIPTFKDHQVINAREKQSVLPDPNSGAASDACPTRDDASSTREVHARGEGKGRERKGKERNIKPTPTAREAAAVAAVVELPTNNPDQPYPLDQSLIDRYHEAYPSTDTLAELNRMALWLENNPDKRRLPGEVNKQIQNWLSNRERDAIREKTRGGDAAPGSTRKASLEDELNDTSWAS